MDEKRAREILTDTIQPDGSLYETYWYVDWVKGEEEVTIDAACTAEQLEAIAWWMKHHLKENKDASARVG